MAGEESNVTNKDENESKLRSVNRLLLRLQKERVGSCETRESSSNKSRSGKDIQGTRGGNEPILRATLSTAGIFVLTNRDLSEGSPVLSCSTEGFVPERSEHRRDYCSYCCRRAPLLFCDDCRDCHGNPMIGHCSDCTDTHQRCHVDCPLECRVLRCLRTSITPLSESADGDEETVATNFVLREIFGSSVALLAIRLVCRRLSQTTGIKAEAVTTTTLTDDTSWRWEDFDCLYELPLPPPYGAMATLVAAALGAVLSNAAGQPPADSHEDLVRSTLGRILGCSHALVDPSLPLGKQVLGRAIYVGQSFYNHSCAPNAYLSTVVGDSSMGGPTARVHLLRPLARGDEITVSYLPLSGLSGDERRESLVQGYGFDCGCKACRESNSPLELPADADRVGMSAIREIQFGLNDRLLDLEAKWKEKGDKHDEGIDLQDEVTSIQRTIDMTSRGIRNQELPECHEVSIESDRLTARACDLWLEAAKASTGAPHSGIPPIATLAGEKHREFFRKTAQIANLFDPVALATQYLAHSSSILLRLKQHYKRQKPNYTDENDTASEHNDDDDENDDGETELRLAESERNRALKLLGTCLGRDHPWIQTLRNETTNLLPIKEQSNEMRDAKRRRT